MDSYNLYRKYRHKKAKHNSGGIVIYCRDDISRGVSIVKNVHNSLVWIKFDKYYFKISEDVLLCAVYIWPENSPIVRLFDCDLFENLQNDITYFENKGKVILSGDFNARTACKNDFIVCDCTFKTDINEYVPDKPLMRCSQDKVSNSYGNKLIELCKLKTLLIVNGRLYDDFSVGRVTYTSSQSASTIDYVLTNESSFSFCRILL